VNGCTFRVLVGDALARLRELPDESVHCFVTSPPYWSLRNYGTPPQVWPGRVGVSAECDRGEHQWEEQGYRLERHGDSGEAGGLDGTHDGQSATRLGTLTCGTCGTCGAWRGSLGLEPSPELFVEHTVTVFRDVRRVLRSDGVMFLNIGDTYASGGRTSRAPDAKNAGREMGTRPATPSGLKPKDLVGIPWLLAFALRNDGWWLRSENIWEKPNVQPEAVEDRPTKAHEQVFLFAKSANYFCDMEAVREATTGTSHPRGLGAAPKAERATKGVKYNSSFSTSVRGVVSSRNLRSVWTIPTAPNSAADHFATFPEALPALCIRMGTSEIGCCRKCGAQVRRIVEKELVGYYRGQVVEDRFEPGTGGARRHHRTITDRRTVGWELGCGCYAGAPVPCKVGDPFSGTGTTGAAALKLGRSYLGVELNSEYAAVSERRLAEIGAAHPEHAEIATPADAPPRAPSQLALVEVPE
jgi:DNA modification methylase